MNDITNIESKILVIRDQQVMLDFDLAEIYGYETKRFNEQVKNNIERFDEDFRFQLTDEEIKKVSRSKFSTLKGRGHKLKYKPYAFTEQGVYMLMTILKSNLAVSQSKKLIRMFKKMKHFIQNNSYIFSEIDSIKQHLVASDIHQKESNQRIDTLFTIMDKYKIEDKQGVFIQGQIFDAYIRNASASPGWRMPDGSTLC